MAKIIGIVRAVDMWTFWEAIADDFTVQAAEEVLYDYYTELSEELGEPIELDPIAIRSEWHEYETDTAFISDMMLGDVDGITEELEDIYEGDIGKRRVYRLSNGNLLVCNS